MKALTVLTLGFTCLLAINTSAAPEKVYKWVDSKGVTHYGQRPPAGKEAEVIKPQIGRSDPVTYSTPASAPEKKVGVNPAEDAKKALKNPVRCETARKNFDTLKTYTHIKIKGEDGEYRYLSPDEQKQKLDEASKAIEESCE